MKQQIAIYLRLSLEDVDKRTSKIKDVSNSIASQRLLIHRHLDETPFLCDLPRLEFCDDGFSGTNFDRPDFTRMIELARKGEISCIVVKDLSRFGRDYLEVGDYLEHIFPFLGIRFKSINDQYDSEKHKGKTIGMDIAFKNLVYDYYSKDLSKKVKSVMEPKQRKCSFVNTVPYGYMTSPENKHLLVIDPVTAPIVRRIFLDVIDGKSCTAIAKALNTEGIPTPAQYKKIHKRTAINTPQWTHSTVHNLLNNIKYTGTMVNHTRESRFIRDKRQRRVPKEEWYVRENVHQAIVTKAEYAMASNAIQRKRKTFRSPHDRSDRVYFCGHCGGKLEKANGTVFACPYHRYQDGSLCENVYWKKSALEDVVLESLKQQIQITRVEARNLSNTSAKKSQDLQAQLTMLKAQYDAIGRETFTLYEEYREGKMTAEKYLLSKDELKTKQTALKRQLADRESQLEKSHRKKVAAAEQAEMVSQMSGLSESQLREHLYDAVEKILVFDAHSIEIIWKFNDLETDTDHNVGVG